MSDDMSDEIWEYTKNTAHVEHTGDKVRICLNIETGLRGNQTLQLAMIEMLRAASLAEHEVCCMSDAGIAQALEKHLQRTSKNTLTITPK